MGRASASTSRSKRTAPPSPPSPPPATGRPCTPSPAAWRPCTPGSAPAEGRRSRTSLAQASSPTTGCGCSGRWDRKPNQPTAASGRVTHGPVLRGADQRTASGSSAPTPCRTCSSTSFWRSTSAICWARERYANVPQIPAGPDLEELYEKLHERMQRRPPPSGWTLFINQYDVAAEPFMTAQDAFDHPQITHNGNWIGVTDPRWARRGNSGRWSSAPRHRWGRRARRRRWASTPPHF